jgi:hypothetical protein
VVESELWQSRAAASQAAALDRCVGRTPSAYRPSNSARGWCFEGLPDRNIRRRTGASMLEGRGVPKGARANRTPQPISPASQAARRGGLICSASATLARHRSRSSSSKSWRWQSQQQLCGFAGGKLASMHSSSARLRSISTSCAPRISRTRSVMASTLSGKRKGAMSLK